MRYINKDEVILTDEGVAGEIAVWFQYNAAAVEALKRGLPGKARSYNPLFKCWNVAASYKNEVIALFKRLGYTVVDNAMTSGAAGGGVDVDDWVIIHYLGNARRRADGDVTALAQDGSGDWSVLFPLAVLETWFQQPVVRCPLDAQDYYERLGVTMSADAAAIKKGYRQVARQWHPDVNDDPRSAAAFQAATEAYETLTDDKKRRRYNAVRSALGAGAAPSGQPIRNSVVWVPPVRCGRVHLVGQKLLGRVVVSAIRAWEPVYNAQGQQMVTRWVASGNGGQVVADWQ